MHNIIWMKPVHLWSWRRTYHLECVWCIWRCSARRQSSHIRNADMSFAPISLLLFFMCVWDRRQDLGRMYVRICEHVHAWVQIIWRMLPSCHAMAVFWRICRPACWAQTPRLSPISPDCLFSSRSSGLKTESSRRWGSSTKHSGKASVHCWKSTTKDFEKLLWGS